ncbi:MAG: pantoate--beta-alanine ligase [Acidobacteria bacterium]|nr:MAG: pantoate--beta-alanine ligase [Acidobacteriota bacterium]PYY21440.1 MAG: pantoate--beta-alanine ligase [Acidobacteriota bacterium]
MKILHGAVETRSEARAAKLQGKRVGFVATMGALHDGHISLVRAAKAKSDFVVASIFVNPTQFGPNEDLAKYPRTFEADRKKLEAEGVDLLFVPSVEEMYPPGAVTFVTAEGISDRLDGRSRPGHFRGVTTVVAKLFHIVEPDVALFGQKDAAQVAIIKRMARDLIFPLEIVVVPIVREPDGLAFSSRNAYLSPEERRQAAALSRALRAIESGYRGGERSSAKLIEAARQVLAGEPAVRVDYIEIVDRDTLDPVSQIGTGTLVAVAAFVGKTRLIDNIILSSTR